MVRAVLKHSTGMQWRWTVRVHTSDKRGKSSCFMQYSACWDPVYTLESDTDGKWQPWSRMNEQILDNANLFLEHHNKQDRANLNLSSDFEVLITWWFYSPSWAVIMTRTESQNLSITRTGRRVDKSSSNICPPPVPIHSAVFFCRQIVFTLPE